MSEFTVYGIPGSPYLRSALLGLHEKKADYRLAALPFAAGAGRTPEHLNRHAFGRIPVLDHGDFRLYETQAILRYLDESLPGTSLAPKEPKSRARMNQIIGIVDWYVFPTLSMQISGERLMSRMFWNRAPDEDRIAKALPAARVCIDELNRLQGSAPFLAGETLSLADLMLAPQLSMFRLTLEGRDLMHGTALDGWLERMQARDSMRATEVERLVQAA